MNTTAEHTDPYPFEDFAPTLSQCFIIVIIGYLLAKLEILSASDVKGVISFASYFAMPSIICISLADADFSDFRWELIFGIFLGKFVTFVVIAGFWLMLDGNIGVAGIVALFCVQSNDLPVGNPLMSSLYKDYRPQMMKYLFLIPAVTGMFFVPVSNVMVGLHREKRKRSKQHGDPVSETSWWQYISEKQCLDQLYGIMKNPVVIATVFGLVLNFLFGGNMPDVLHQPIKVAAATIPGIALAMLGFSFVRKERYLLSSAVVPATVLLVLKMVLTPILLHSILKVLTEESTSSKLLSDFALLYGIVSPAMTVFQSGLEFRKSLAVMSVALILTSFGCFPTSYVVARITIAPVHKLSTYVPDLKNVLFWTACISIFCNVVVSFTMNWKNQWHQAASSYIMYLVFTQTVTCCGIVLWTVTEKSTWATYCEMALYYGGEIAGYLWTGMLAITLVFNEKNFILAKKGFAIISFTAFSVSGLITLVMCLLIPHNAGQNVYVVGRARSNFEFLQLIMTSILLSISLIVVAACLIYHFKTTKPIRRDITEASAFENTVFYIQEQEEAAKDVHDNHGVRNFYHKDKELSFGEKSSRKLEGNDEANFYYEDVVKNSECQNDQSSIRRDWKFRLSSLLILLGLTMLVRFIGNLFKLVHSRALEVMIPMEFLQSTLFIGQGIFILLTFGFDIRTLTHSLKKCYRKRRYGNEDASARCRNAGEKRDIVQICNQFCTFYYNECFKDIAKERRWKDVTYKDSFWGHQLVDWLISEGLCQDDAEAEGQGQKLLEGGVIQHVTQKHDFYDAPYLYHFVRKGNDSAVIEYCVKF